MKMGSPILIKNVGRLREHSIRQVLMCYTVDNCNEEQGHTLEQWVDDKIICWEQRTRVCKPQTHSVHAQTVWTNNKGQDSPMIHGCDADYKYMTSHKRTDDDNSTLTPNSNNSVSWELHGLSLYSCWVCWTEGHLSWYCSQTNGIDKQEQDSHTLYPHMMWVPLHAILQLCNRWTLPQTDNSDSQREKVWEWIRHRNW